MKAYKLSFNDQVYNLLCTSVCILFNPMHKYFCVIYDEIIELLILVTKTTLQKQWLNKLKPKLLNNWHNPKILQAIIRWIIVRGVSNV